MRHAILALVLAAASLEADAAIRGSVLTQTGNPVPAAAVRLYPVESREGVLERLQSESVQAEAVAEGVTDSRGNFSLEAPAGQATWRVQIAKEGYAPSGSMVVADFDLAGVILRPASLERGVVRDGARVMPGAIVRFADEDGTEWVARTDEEGRYTVPSPRGWATRVSVISPDGRVWNEVSIRSELKVDRALRRGKAISGTVVGADGKTPAAGATIRMDGIEIGATDEQGAFRIAAPAAGWSLLEFTAGEGSALRSSPAQPEIGAVRLGKSASISGSIRAGAGVVVGARVVAYPDSGTPLVMDIPRGEAIADAKGRFTFGNLPAGRYRLQTRHPVYSVDNAVVDLAPGQSVEKQLTAAPLSVATGHVVDEDGRPLSAARVTPRSEEGRARFEVARMFSELHGWSAGDGRFVIRSIPSDSSFALEARKQGLPPGRTEPLKVTAAEPLTGVRITIPQGHEVSGRVIDSEENPIAGAVIRAEETRTDTNRIVIIGSAADRSGEGVTSDAEGRFTMRLSAGRWDVSAGGELWSRSMKNGVEVSANTEELEFILQPAVSVRGRVVRKGSGGIADANVSVMSRDAGQRSAITGPDGSFEIDGLTAGTSMLVVTKSDEMLREVAMVTAPDDDVLIEIPPGSTLSGRVIDADTKAPITPFTISVGGDRSGGGMVVRAAPIPRSFQSEDGTFVLQNVTFDPAELTVRAPGYVEKRVGGVEAPAGETREDIEIALSRGTMVSGRVSDPNGRPLSGVTISREESSRAVIGPPMGGGTATDAEGRFEVGPFSGEAVSLRFEKGGYRDERREVKLSGKSASVDVRLTRGAALSGHVVTEAGAPVGGAQVSVRSGGDFMDQTSATTDSSGAFRIEGIGEGRMRVIASRTGYTTAVEEDVDPATSGPLRLVLSEGGTVVGRVRGLSPAELPEAAVEVRSGSSSQRAQVDGSGAFRVEGVAPGTARVTASVGRMGPRRTSPAATVEVARGSEAYVELDMSQGHEVSGLVRMDGVPAGGVLVSFTPADPVVQTRASVTTDSSGSYRLTGLQPGPYRVSAMRFGSGDISWQGEFRVEGDDRYDIDIEGVMVSGRVIDAGTGNGVEGAAVEIRRVDGGGPVMIGPGRGPVSGPDGSFSFRNITPGRWTVRASAEGMGAATETIEVGSSGATVQLRLSPSEGVVMRLVDASTGTPVAAFVTATDGAGRTVLTDLLRPRVDGTVTLPLAPGNYRLRAQAQGYAPRWFTVTSPSSGVTLPLSVGGTLHVNVRGSEPLRVRVVDVASGQALSGAPGGIMALLPGSTPMQHVPAGQLRIEVLDEAGAVVRTEVVTVAERGVAMVDL